MFGNKKTGAVGGSNDRFDTIIANNTSISGDIVAEGNVRIDGSYTGDIKSNSEVIIGENGLIHGNIEANSVSVSGKVEGNIKCEGLLEIYSHGVVEGDISIKSLSIVEGGIHNGYCKMNASTNISQKEQEKMFDDENDTFEIVE